MSAHRARSLRTAEANKNRHGADFYRRIGKLGGSKCVPKGFARMSPEKLSAVSAKGVSISKRGPKR